MRRGLAAYRAARVLVVGANGFIGRWVTRALSEAGADLHLLVRDPAAAPGVLTRWAPRSTIIKADLARPGTAADVARRLRPAVTFNLAGYGVDPTQRQAAIAERLNAGLVAELAEACAGAGDASWPGQQLVHAGSALEYGAVAGDLREDTPPNPTTLYGRTKLAGTNAVVAATRAGTLRAVVARLFTVYGPGEHAGRLLPSLIKASMTRKPLPLTDGTQRRDFTYVEDVAEGLLRLGVLDADGVGAVNLATGRLETVRRFAERAAVVLGLPAELLCFGELPTRGEEMAHDDVTVSRLGALTGWHPATTIEEGVRRTAQFLESGA